MSKFIQLTLCEDKYVYINFDKVLSFNYSDDQEGTWIRFGLKKSNCWIDYDPVDDDTNICFVKETPEQIMKLIEEVDSE